LQREEFEVAASASASRWSIAYYVPADARTVQEGMAGKRQYFEFANDGLGNGYFIDPTRDDPCVFFEDLETGKLEKVCDRFTEFMKWPRFEQGK